MHTLPKQSCHVLSIASLDKELIELLKKDLAAILDGRMRTTTCPRMKRAITAIATSVETY